MIETVCSWRKKSIALASDDDHVFQLVHYTGVTGKNHGSQRWRPWNMSSTAATNLERTWPMWAMLKKIGVSGVANTTHHVFRKRRDISMHQSQQDARAWALAQTNDLQRRQDMFRDFEVTDGAT